MGWLSQVALTAAVSSVTGALVSALFVALKAGGRKAAESNASARAADAAMQAGMRALLWRELTTMHEQALDAGSMDVTARRHLESVYSAYHGLGGNGTGTRLYHDMMQLPVA